MKKVAGRVTGANLGKIKTSGTDKRKTGQTVEGDIIRCAEKVGGEEGSKKEER